MFGFDVHLWARRKALAAERAHLETLTLQLSASFGSFLAVKLASELRDTKSGSAIKLRGTRLAGEQRRCSPLDAPLNLTGATASGAQNGSYVADPRLAR
jgi:hypothetical protein